MAKTPHCQCRGHRVQSLVRKLDPTCCNRVHMLQLRPGAVKFSFDVHLLRSDSGPGTALPFGHDGDQKQKQSHTLWCGNKYNEEV